MALNNYTIAKAFNRDTLYYVYEGDDFKQFLAAITKLVLEGSNVMSSLQRAVVAQTTEVDSGFAMPLAHFHRFKSAVRIILKNHPSKREELEAIVNLPFSRVISGPEVFKAKHLQLGGEAVEPTFEDEDES